MCYHEKCFDIGATVICGRAPHHLSSVMMTRRPWLATMSCLLALLQLSLLGVSLARSPVDFAHDVAPIFEQHCIRCHEPGNKKSGLSLATFADLKTKEYVISGD